MGRSGDEGPYKVGNVSIISIPQNSLEGGPLFDANSGFEPRTFTPDVYARWKPLLNAGRGPWRFAYDEMGERADPDA